MTGRSRGDAAELGHARLPCLDRLLYDATDAQEGARLGGHAYRLAEVGRPLQHLLELRDAHRAQLTLRSHAPHREVAVVAALEHRGLAWLAIGLGIGLGMGIGLGLGVALQVGLGLGLGVGLAEVISGAERRHHAHLGDIYRDLARCSEIWGDVGRSGEI